MPVIYFGSGIFLLLGKNIFNFSEFQKIGLGIILVAYGLMRFYFAIKKMKEEKNENEI